MFSGDPSAPNLTPAKTRGRGRRALLAGVSLPAALALGLQMAQAASSPVGGKGGADPLATGTKPGGAGGTTTDPNAPSVADPNSSEGGGGPGGAGGAGGQDTFTGLGGAGGDGGVTAYTGLTLPIAPAVGGDGSNGGNGQRGANEFGGGGGGGGAGGYGAVITGPVNGDLRVNITGGAGGLGGNGADGNGGAGFGGGGGGGGVGLSIDSSSLDIYSTVSGGNGGAGGAMGGGFSNYGASSGAGGDGGDGIVARNSTFTVLGTVSGGNGGAGGVGLFPGADGAGGAGVSGSGLDISVAQGGVISGGLDGAGQQTGLALDLSGQNTLRLFTGGSLTGGVKTSGALSITAFDPNNGTIELTNEISGSGSLIVFGPAGTTLKLSGLNSYTGGTLVTARLSVNNDLNLGDVNGGLTLDYGGTLVTTASFASSRSVTLGDNGGGSFDIGAGDTLALLGAITGTGGLGKLGDGALLLSGTSSYSGATLVQKGTIQAVNTNVFSQASAFSVASGATLDLNGFDQTVGSLSGAGSVTLGSGKLTTGGDNSSTVYAGVISGGGGLTKTGSGNFVLTGANSYTGLTTISGGTLSVNGSLAGNVLVSGGALGGNGSVGSVTIGAGGALAPGNSIGTITVNGNLAFAPGSFYRVEVSPTDADRTNVTGSASLTGATVQTIFAPGSYVSRSHTILSAAGGLGGTTFSGVSAPAGFITSLSYSPTDVTLNLTAGLGRNDLLTFNQRSAAGAINAIFNTGGVVPGGAGLFFLSGTSLGAGLDSLSGEVHASTATALQEESAYVRGAVLGRLRQTGGATGSDGQMMALAPNEVGQTTGVTEKAPGAPRLSSVAFWAQGFGAWGRVGNDLNAATLHRDAAGFMSGMDAKLGDFGRAGVAAGYTNSQNRLDARGFANIETANVSAYGGAGLGPIDVRLGAAYSFHTIRTDRTIAFPGFMDRASASYGGGTAQVFGEAGYRFKIANVSVEPFAGGAFVHVNTDNAVEQAMAAGLSVSGTSFDVGYSNVGARFWTTLDTGAGTKLLPRASFAWRHAFSGLAPYGVMAFATAPGASFATFGVPIARDALLAEGGFDLAITRNATIGVSYAGQISDRVQDHAAKGRLSWSF